MKTIKPQPAENAVVGVRVVGDGVGGLGEMVVGDGVGGSELLTDSCSRQSPPLMFLETNRQLQAETGVQISNSLVQLSNNGFARVLLTNQHSLTHKIEEGAEVGCATPVVVVLLHSFSDSVREKMTRHHCSISPPTPPTSVRVSHKMRSSCCHRQRLQG